MKTVIHNLIPVLMSAICFLALINYISSGIKMPDTNTYGSIYDMLGVFATTADSSKETTHESVTGTGGTSSVVTLSYISGMQSIGSYINFKSLFHVTIDGATYDGTNESTGDFALYIKDIRKNDVSVLNKVTQATMNELLNTDHYYNVVQVADGTYAERLYFFSSGIYEATIIVRDPNGFKHELIATIPVVD